MVYDPSGTSIRERILQDVEDVLGAIATPSYGTTVRFVRRWNGNVLVNIPEYPCALIVPLPEKTDDSLTGVLSHVMEIGLCFGLSAITWPEDINKLMADVRVALMADPQRGGLATKTQITDENVSDNDPEQTVGSAQMIIQIPYRTTFDDPNENR